MRTAILVVAIIFLTSCVPDADMPMYQQSHNADSLNVMNQGRVKVTRVGVFMDDLAYNSRRGVYLIQDTYTGIEYIGVSGVGVTEVGQHTRTSGKTSYSVQDER